MVIMKWREDELSYLMDDHDFKFNINHLYVLINCGMLEFRCQNVDIQS